MYLTTDNILDTVKSLPVKSIGGKVCVSIMDIAHTLRIKNNDLAMFMRKLESLETTGKVTLIRGPFGLISGVIAN